jgi:hypothetical protein
MQEDQFSFGTWYRSLDILDGRARLLLGSCGDVDFGILAVEDLRKFLANTGIGTRYDEDLRGERVKMVAAGSFSAT